MRLSGKLRSEDASVYQGKAENYPKSQKQQAFQAKEVSVCSVNAQERTRKQIGQ